MGHDAIGGLAAQSVKLNAWPLGLIAALVAGGAATAHVYGFPFQPQLFEGFWALFVSGGFATLLCVALMIGLARDRPDRPFGYIKSRLDEWRVGRRTVFALPILLAAPVLFSTFSSIKAGIPVMRPFDMDLVFVELDRALHGGVDPWRLLEPILRWPAGVFGLNLLYHLWFFLFCGALAGAAVMDRNLRLRTQFLIAFILCWVVLGLVAATQFASVGPVYLKEFYPGVSDPFAEQMALLRAADSIYPVWALDVQTTLLNGVRDPDTAMIGGGISAMPSLHVSIAVLLALFAQRLNRWLGAAAWVFAALTMLGSVVLAWHYAVDGYVSILATPLIWIVSGWLARLQAPVPVAQPASV